MKGHIMAIEVIIMSRKTPAPDKKPPLWGMALVGAVLLIAVVGYFIRY